MANNAFGDKEIMTDILNSQKTITGSYNNGANEAAGAALKSGFMNILNEEHQIQHEVFLEMQKRGWYCPPQAEQQKINQTKQKFSSNQ